MRWPKDRISIVIKTVVSIGVISKLVRSYNSMCHKIGKTYSVAVKNGWNVPELVPR